MAAPGSKFLDPAANARGCLRGVALLFFVGLALVALVLFLAFVR